MLALLVALLFQVSLSAHPDPLHPRGQAPNPAPRADLGLSDLCFAPTQFSSYTYPLNITDRFGTFTHYKGIEQNFGSYTGADVLGTFNGATQTFTFVVYFNCPTCQYDSRLYTWSNATASGGVDGAEGTKAVEYYGMTWAYYRDTNSPYTFYDPPKESGFLSCAGV
eukprot:TRINITY_DN4308_c0_g1_i1.p1 TRINITY_DN4308_c0_g1~~TRINITY_DN4308_c0_g1_i1.p1  ORF type:complete len:166 (-),score=24.11 TRINITY_DN4308_c0_g1_i1:17-514(-)